MLKTRLLSGIVLVAIALLTIISGGYVLYGTLLVVSLIGVHELYRAVGVEEKEMNLLSAVGYLGVICYYFLLYTGLDA